MVPGLSPSPPRELQTAQNARLPSRDKRCHRRRVCRNYADALEKCAMQTDVKGLCARRRIHNRFGQALPQATVHAAKTLHIR